VLRTISRVVHVLGLVLSGGPSGRLV
jgi:hypothetical protein